MQSRKPNENYENKAKNVPLKTVVKRHIIKYF